jgi:drug/metabolite transporter (DMT)-like permease
VTSQRVAPIDVLLLLMAVIWGTNYSIVKHAFAEIPPQAFNAMRMLIASGIFLVLMAVLGRMTRRNADGGPEAGRGGIAGIFHSSASITLRDWRDLVALGFVGHFLYQYCFINGLALTSVANSSLMLAATPVVIAIVTAIAGSDRVGPLHWIGAALSMAGIYIAVGQGVHVGTESLRGDLLMAAAVVCWAAYTIGARSLMARHSPLRVTGLSMSIGTVPYVLVALNDVGAVRWLSLGAGTWSAIVYSAVFALCISFTIWYVAVRDIGSSRTAVYSNLIPIVAMLTAAVFLGEPLGARTIAGAAAVLSGVALTRVGRPQRLVIPAEE